MSPLVAATAIIRRSAIAVAAVANHLTDLLTRLALAHRLSSSMSRQSWMLTHWELFLGEMDTTLEDL